MNKKMYFPIYIYLASICFSSCANYKIRNCKKYLKDNVRYYISNSYSGFDCFIITNDMIKNGRCDVTYDIDYSLADNYEFGRHRKIAGLNRNKFDTYDSGYTTAPVYDGNYICFRFDTYETIEAFPTVLTININLKKEVKFNFGNTGIIWFFWVPGCNVETGTLNGVALTSTYLKIVINLWDGFIGFDDNTIQNLSRSYFQYNNGTLIREKATTINPYFVDIPKGEEAI